MSDQPGFKKLKVPGHNEMRPHMRDISPDANNIEYCRPVSHVMDLGAPRDALTYWRGVASPSSPEFKAGEPYGINPSGKPEEQSVHIQTGITWPNRDEKDTPEA